MQRYWSGSKAPRNNANLALWLVRIVESSVKENTFCAHQDSIHYILSNFRIYDGVLYQRARLSSGNLDTSCTSDDILPRNNLTAYTTTASIKKIDQIFILAKYKVETRRVLRRHQMLLSWAAPKVAYHEVSGAVLEIHMIMRNALAIHVVWCCRYFRTNAHVSSRSKALAEEASK